MTLFSQSDIECMKTYLDNHTYMAWNYKDPKKPLRILCKIANNFQATTDQLVKLDVKSRSLKHYIKSFRKEGFVRDTYPYEISFKGIDILNTLLRLARDCEKYGL